MIDVGIIGAVEMETWSAIFIKPDQFNSALDWCEQIEGTSKFAKGRTAFWFEFEQDATMFALRWAS